MSSMLSYLKRSTEVGHQSFYKHFLKQININIMITILIISQIIAFIIAYFIIKIDIHYLVIDDDYINDKELEQLSNNGYNLISFIFISTKAISAYRYVFIYNKSKDKINGNKNLIQIFKS